MLKTLVVALAAMIVAGCAESSKVAVTDRQQTVQTKSRSEPIFYNGKHYRLRYDYVDGANAFDMKVSGETAAMTDKQGKDAEAIAVSSLRYFACPDGQTGKLIDRPRYADGVWSMQARCG
jgi:hypothetical protein